MDWLSTTEYGTCTWTDWIWYLYLHHLALIWFHQVYGSCIATWKYTPAGDWRWLGSLWMGNCPTRSCHHHHPIFQSVDRHRPIHNCGFWSVECWSNQLFFFFFNLLLSLPFFFNQSFRRRKGFRYLWVLMFWFFWLLPNFVLSEFGNVDHWWSIIWTLWAVLDFYHEIFLTNTV